MRLLSWNVKAAESPGSGHSPNLEGIAAAIAAQSPDVVCLQEAALGADDGAGSFRTLRKLLGLDGRLQVGPRSESRATAVLWRPGAIELRDQTTHYAELFYHSAAAIVSLNVTGMAKPLTVVSAHLHPHSADARVIEAAVFHMKADAGQYTILAADAHGIGLRDPEPDWALTRPGFPVKWPCRLLRTLRRPSEMPAKPVTRGRHASPLIA